MKRQNAIYFAVKQDVLDEFDGFVARIVALARNKGYSRLLALKTVDTYDPDWGFASRGVGKTDRGKQVTSTPKLVNKIMAQLRSNTPKQVSEDELDDNVKTYWESNECEKFRLALADRFENDMLAKLTPISPALSAATESSSRVENDSIQREYTGKPNQENSRLLGQTFEDLLDSGLSIQDLSKRMQAISDKYPFPVQHEGEWGHDENWEGIYKRVPHYGYFIFRGSELIGYFLFVFLDEETFARGIDGENINETMSISDIETPTIPGEYKMYFVDAFVHPDYFSGATFRMLAKRFYEILEHLSDQTREIYVSHIVANISTFYARKLVERCGFLKVCDHKVHKKFDKHMKQCPTEIFSLDMRQNSAKLFGKSEHVTKNVSLRYSHFYSV